MNAPSRIAFVSPRFIEGGSVGGAETLLKALAVRLAARGAQVEFLTTCARDHFTWRNEVAPGTRTAEGLTVRFFPVDEGRDAHACGEAGRRICSGRPIAEADEAAWLRHSVNSEALCAHLRAEAPRLDRVIAGPYLFGLIRAAASVAPAKTILVPCLHDEPFARMRAFSDMFRGVRRLAFNSEPERDLAIRLYGVAPSACSVVGLGIDPFDADPAAFARANRIEAPYLLYSGRREPLKGTPLLIDYLAAFRERTRRDVRLVLTGAGPWDAPPCLRPHILDAGFVAEQVKREAMAGALAFCHPSLNESLSIVLLEAWMAGAPALVRAGCAVMLHHCRAGNGGLWFRNYPEFEEALLTLLDNPALRRAMGAAGRKYVLDSYSWSAVDRRLGEALAG